MDDCVFCGIVGKTVPAEIVFADDTVVAFKDTSPQEPVHLLVVPREHIAAINAVTDDQATLLGKIMLTAAKLGRSETDGRFSLEINAGSRIDVHHLHVHVKGNRKGGDVE